MALNTDSKSFFVGLFLFCFVSLKEPSLFYLLVHPPNGPNSQGQSGSRGKDLHPSLQDS